MLLLKLEHFIVILLTFLQGVFSHNITIFSSTLSNISSTILVNATLLQTTVRTLPSKIIMTEDEISFASKSNNTPTTNFCSEDVKSTEKNTYVISAVNVTEIIPKNSSLPKAFENSLNESIVIVPLNSTFEDFTFDLTNDTSKSNLTVETKLTEFPCSFWILKPVDAAAVVAGIFLVLGVVGYGGCVIYRRYLQRKYGDSEILSHEEFYDTTDLRYFEI